MFVGCCEELQESSRELFDGEDAHDDDGLE
jgi:hypothetical protein